MAIILKANKVNLFVSSVLFVFWYHSPNVSDTPHIWNISWLRVTAKSRIAVSPTVAQYHSLTISRNMQISSQTMNIVQRAINRLDLHPRGATFVTTPYNCKDFLPLGDGIFF
jgi:hypothetical protein